MEDFEGDILLTKVQKAMTTPFHLDVAAAGVWAQADFLWPERIVPYYIPPDLGKISNTLDFFFVFCKVCSAWCIVSYRAPFGK